MAESDFELETKKRLNERGAWRETGVKICPKCDVEKPLSEFSTRRSGPREGHPSGHCMDCMVAANRERRERDVGHYEKYERPSKLRRQYGMTVEDYDRMLAEQGGCCAICKSEVSFSRGYKNSDGSHFQIDHDHTTGAVRGLLCSKCNRGLGYFQDSTDNLEAAIEYLIRHQQAEGDNGGK